MSGSGSQTRHGVMIGRNLAHYEVLEELGRGGMGVVYKARDTRLDRLVALKLLPEELAGDPQRVELLRREAQAIAALNHPRIVTVYSVEEADGQLFLTMEHVEGKTLDRAIPKHGLDLERFFKIAIPLADAVATAHDQKIVHRDLKPGNILLSSDDRPKILDFGLARLRPGEPLPSSDGGEPAGGRPATQLETLDGKVVGTPAYMSPEQLTGGPVDHRTDLFSLGIIYYEMATGRHPFRRREGSPISTITGESPDSVTEVRTGLPRQLGRIIHRCLEKDPELRMQSARDLRNELEEVRRELGEPAGYPPRRGLLRRLLLPAAALLVVFAAGTGLLLRQRFAGEAAPGPATHLNVVETRIFPGDRGPDYFRLGVIDTLRRHLRRLSGVYLADGDGHPLPDYIVEADVRRAADSFSLIYRLRSREPEEEEPAAVREGGTGELFALLDQASDDIARALRARIGRSVRYHTAPPPTTDPQAWDLFLRAAQALRQGGEGGSADAARFLEQALARDSRFALARAVGGRLRLDAHQASPDPELVRAAEADCREAAALDGELAEARHCLGDALLELGRALEAVEAYRHAIRLNPTDLKPYVGLRRADRQLGLPGALEDTLKELIRIHPDYWGGYFSLARYYLDREDPPAALEQFQRAVERAPEHARAQALLGTVYYLLGRFEEATRSNQRSMAVKPNWDAAYNLGALHYIFRRFEEAVTAYEQAVELRSDDFASRGRLGWACYWVRERCPEAGLHLERAIELAQKELAEAPDAADLHIMVAVFEALLGARERSLESLAKALDSEPDSGHHLFLAGVAYAHLGENDTAIGYLEQAVALGYPRAEIRTFRDLDPLRDDPRFRALL